MSTNTTIYMTTEIPQAYPIEAATQVEAQGQLYGLSTIGTAGPQIDSLTDVLLSIPAQNGFTYISLKTGNLFTSLPSNAFALPQFARVDLAVGIQ